MNNVVKKLFDSLGISPNEKFKIKPLNSNIIHDEDDEYILTEDLVLWSEKFGIWTNGLRFLLTKYEIVKINEKTK